MCYSFARVSAVIGMNIEDYYKQGKRSWIRLHEKGGKFHEVPAHHNAEAYLDEYLVAAGIGDERKEPTGALGPRDALSDLTSEPRGALAGFESVPAARRR
jgi:hypothetical protein